MALAGLVSYDGSGSSSEDEDEVMTEESKTLPTENSSAPSNATVVNGVSTRAADASNSGSLKPAIKPSVIFSKFIDDDEDDFMDERGDTDDISPAGDNDIDKPSVSWSKFLPEPKKVPVEVEEEEDVEIGPIPPKKTYGDEEQPPPKETMGSITATKVQGKVRISIPFLNSLNEDDPSDDQEKRKYVEPSKKGSGLFAILPQPKNSASDGSNPFLVKTSKPSSTATQETSKSSDIDKPQSSRASMNRLIPDSVKNKLKRPAPEKLAEVRAKYMKKGLSESAVGKKGKDSDDSDEEGGGDFFSLDSKEVTDPEALEKLKLPMPDFNARVQTAAATSEEQMEIEDSEYETPSTSSSSQAPDLMKFIQPKKGRKQDVQIIDIKADDLRPDNTEWIKNITDESAVPVRRGKGLGGMVKRKHQITYLAFEAKAREQELKNQWAQNRANKMATQNKYGF